MRTIQIPILEQAPLDQQPEASARVSLKRKSSAYFHLVSASFPEPAQHPVSLVEERGKTCGLEAATPQRTRRHAI